MNTVPKKRDTVEFAAKVTRNRNIYIYIYIYLDNLLELEIDIKMIFF